MEKLKETGGKKIKNVTLVSLGLTATGKKDIREGEAFRRACRGGGMGGGVLKNNLGKRPQTRSMK